MTSPFPGMDPYLEDPAIWPGVHSRIVVFLASALNRVLPDEYIADIEERLYVAHSSRQIIPDIVARKKQPDRVTSTNRGGTAVLSRADEPSILFVGMEETSEPFVEIRHLTDPRRVVTVIEVISHTNKAPGAEGRESYLTKQREVLGSDLHLVEIDLLRKGQHVAAPPYERVAVEFGFRDYLISVSRSSDRAVFELYQRTVREKLPFIKVPLAKGDLDVDLDCWGFGIH